MSSFFENAFASFKSFFAGGASQGSKGSKGSKGKKSPPSTPRRGTRQSTRNKTLSIKAREAASSEDEVKKLRKASPKKKVTVGVETSRGV